MSAEERIAALEKENGKFREDNDRRLKIIEQMEMTLTRMIGRYITENSKNGICRNWRRPFSF